MKMEIESGDGSKTLLIPGSITHFGRGAGFNYDDDRTVSRRQISIHPYPSSDHERDGPPVRFEVVGKNPVWVHNSKSGGVKTYRRSERGELESGDMFCVSAKNPVWFTLRRTDSESQGNAGKKKDTLVSNSTDPDYEQRGVEEFDPDSINLSDIDPVKEFGLMVMGHEFDAYPKKMIKDIKNWDWDIEESGDENENDEGGRRRWKRKRSCKNDGDGDDDEWRGESEAEEEKEAINKSRKPQIAKYMSTRSKNYGKPSKGAGKEKILAQTEGTCDEDSDDEDSDETLGGFIVVDEEIGEDDTAEDDDEEEEFDEEEDDLEEE
ncbi:unnamed protein product [Cuscuta europaea]|uniref:Uncharacterized protein n=1 Tax=Cuscuta europaea TaxID=41803 RepID=A0A9P0Z703_CUSEU|nr:unnamed protein product [Cuscuta europaea]